MLNSFRPNWLQVESKVKDAKNFTMYVLQINAFFFIYKYNKISIYDISSMMIAHYYQVKTSI